jgi:N-carbamoylputrescine amidase
MSQQEVARRPLVIGLVQAQAAESPVENLERAVAGIEEAARRGARVVCLQELFRSRYFCQSEDPTRFELAEPVPGPTTETLGKLASRLGVAVIASLFERRTGGLYHNTAVVLGPDGRMVMRYRKMHIPDDPLYYEKYYFTPGDLGFPNAEVAGARVGALVCWDQWFPEARDPLLSDGHRLAVRRRAGGGRGPARRLGDGAARPRHHQRRLRGRGEPGRHGG